MYCALDFISVPDSILMHAGCCNLVVLNYTVSTVLLYSLLLFASTHDHY